MNLKTLNQLAAADAEELFRKCCGTSWWARQMAACRPFANPNQVHDTADAIFDEMAEGHWFEAFAAHPKIGELNPRSAKDSSSKVWSADDQAAVQDADHAILKQLAHDNTTYRGRFGYPFIVCDTGLSATEVLDALRQRLGHHPATEAPVAAGQQRKITHLRLDELLDADADA